MRTFIRPVTGNETGLYDDNDSNSSITYDPIADTDYLNDITTEPPNDEIILNDNNGTVNLAISNTSRQTEYLISRIVDGDEFEDQDQNSEDDSSLSKLSEIGFYWDTIGKISNPPIKSEAIITDLPIGVIYRSGANLDIYVTGNKASYWLTSKNNDFLYNSDEITKRNLQVNNIMLCIINK